MRQGFGELDAAINNYGADGLLDLVMSLIADDGLTPYEASQAVGIKYGVLKMWIRDDPARCSNIDFARECFADKLVYDALEESRTADVDSLQVSKLRIDTNMKIAGKLSRREWGDEKASLVINNNIGVDASLVGFASDLLDKIRCVSVQEREDEGITDV